MEYEREPGADDCADHDGDGDEYDARDDGPPPELDDCDDPDPDAWRAGLSDAASWGPPRRERLVKPPAETHGHVVEVRDDYGAGLPPLRVAVVNAGGVKTDHAAPGYDRPFRVTAWELRAARHDALLGTLGRDCVRLARVTGVQPPRWMERAACELRARGVVDLDVAAQIAAWHRKHARKRAAVNSEVPWRDVAVEEPEPREVPAPTPERTDRQTPLWYYAGWAG